MPFLFIQKKKGFKCSSMDTKTNSVNLRKADVLCDSLHILKEFVQLQRRNVRVPLKKNEKDVRGKW